MSSIHHWKYVVGPWVIRVVSKEAQRTDKLTDRPMDWRVTHPKGVGSCFFFDACDVENFSSLRKLKYYTQNYCHVWWEGEMQLDVIPFSNTSCHKCHSKISGIHLHTSIMHERNIRFHIQFKGSPLRQRHFFFVDILCRSFIFPRMVKKDFCRF